MLPCQMPKPFRDPEPVDELTDFLYQLENSIERAESDDWTVLSLNVKQGENLLRMIRQRLMPANTELSRTA